MVVRCVEQVNEHLGIHHDPFQHFPIVQAARQLYRNSRRAQTEAEKSRLAAEEAIRQKEEMRARLLKQLNQALETRDTDRGLIVSMPDVLFDSGQYTLKPAARETAG